MVVTAVGNTVLFVMTLELRICCWAAVGLHACFPVHPQVSILSLFWAHLWQRIATSSSSVDQRQLEKLLRALLTLVTATTHPPALCIFPFPVHLLRLRSKPHLSKRFVFTYKMDPSFPHFYDFHYDKMTFLTSKPSSSPTSPCSVDVFFTSESNIMYHLGLRGWRDSWRQNVLLGTEGWGWQRGSEKAPSCWELLIRRVATWKPGTFISLTGISDTRLSVLHGVTASGHVMTRGQSSVEITQVLWTCLSGSLKIPAHN